MPKSRLSTRNNVITRTIEETKLGEPTKPTQTTPPFISPFVFPKLGGSGGGGEGFKGDFRKILKSKRAKYGKPSKGIGIFSEGFSKAIYGKASIGKQGTKWNTTKQLQRAGLTPGKILAAGGIGAFKKIKK